MNKYKFWKKIYHSINLFIGFLYYLITKKNRENFYQSLIFMFCVTQGRICDYYSLVISILKPRKVTKNFSSSLFPEINQGCINDIVSDLRKNGYSVFPLRVPDSILCHFDKFSTENLCCTRPSGQLKIIHEMKFDPQNVSSPRYDYDPQKLIEDDCIKRFVFDPLWKEIASKYMNTEPIMDYVAMWWQTSYGEADDNSAQKFHFDLDRLKWLKFFVYLNNVDEKNGPHAFIKGTHIPGNIPSFFLEKGYVRLEDEEIFRYYDGNQIKEFCSNRGTIIIEDTKGLHKGKKALNGQRLTFNLQYCNSYFGTPNVKKLEIK
jgi:hypothetical protein